MADYAEQLGLDRVRMGRRIIFLNDRADWHDRRKSPLDTACAATARRDAGIIALLLDQKEVASELLAKAGAEFASIGLFAGYMLQSLVSPERVHRGDFAAEDMIARFGHSSFTEDPDVRRVREEGTLPFEKDSRQSPQQLLNLYQALRGRRIERTHFASEVAFRRLQVNASATIGLSGLPVGSYLKLFDRFGSNDANSRDLDTVFAAAIRRRDLIDAARADEFHWRMMMKPAELVDLDLIALGMNAFEAGEISTSMLFETVERVGTEAALPFLLARDLQGPAAPLHSFE
ncbi:hypothetical protein D5400_01575 [Georhizobium profundi]|uniref:Uncharacterized protein n=1 Tax=Georhizobium profundi TaxID=2341112 RepID=A0A3S9AZK1_9HYPH|nr:hypothetical protein [Georhizobium profundi]AZN70134.1 hypothetical protein D5400_01575 [Georhizobium profundi]